jgi:hypothetical protein
MPSNYGLLLQEFESRSYSMGAVTINDYDAGQKCKCDDTKFFHYLQSYHVVFANSY